MKTTEGLGAYSRDCVEAFDLIDIEDSTLQIIRDAKHGDFTPLGDIMLMGEPVAAGIKKRHVWETNKRVARELYVADRLLEAFPSRSNSLPLFTFAVCSSKEDRHLGILTEDFTHNGQRTLSETRNSFGISGGWRKRTRESTPEGLHRDVYDALDGRVYAEAFRHMVGFAFDREVMIDFDDVTYPPTDELEQYEELVESITIVV